MTEGILTTETTLPASFEIRRPSWDDLQAVADLIVAADIAESGEDDFTAEDLAAEWKKTEFNLADDAWVVVSPQGQIVGYEELWTRDGHAHLNGDGYVHPEFLGLGIGTALLRQLVERAQEHVPLAPPGRRVFVRNGLYRSDDRAALLHENEGFKPVRFFWRMRIELQEPPTEPVWPAGLRVRPIQPGLDDQAAFEALHDSFRDHWGYTPWRYDDWRARFLDRENFDPSLFFLAVVQDGPQAGEIAGASLCAQRPGYGWVSQLGVRRPWRKLGLGLALLRKSFGEFYRRGNAAIELGVDASSQTGATRLYERAGMHIAREYILYEKEIRPGSED
jgi:mycothiol synthase